MKVSVSPTNADKTVTADVTSGTATTGETAKSLAAATGSDGQTKDSATTTLCFTLTSVKNDTFEDKAVTGTLVVGVQKVEQEGFTFTDSVLVDLKHGEDVHKVEGTIVSLLDDAKKDGEENKTAEPKWTIDMNMSWDAEAAKFVMGKDAEPATACAAGLLKLINFESDKKEPIHLEFFTKAAMAAEGEDKKPFLTFSCDQADEKAAVQVSPSAEEPKEKVDEAVASKSSDKKPSPADPKEADDSAADSKKEETAVEISKEAAEDKKEDKNPTPPKKQKTEKEGEEEEKKAETSA